MSQSSPYPFTLADMVREHFDLVDGYDQMLAIARLLFPEQIEDAIAMWNQLESEILEFDHADAEPGISTAK